MRSMKILGGEGYKIVMKKLSRNSPQKVLSATKMSNIVDSLFPAHPVQRHHMVVVDPASIPTFTEENLKNAVALMKNGKAPGPDGIPVEAIAKKKADTQNSATAQSVHMHA
ncbi:hypothetical protein LSTR_LSTR010465 [Laodelphax striatellus]|uniref:Uncharacterized protein n=1 Tax=Laodelphax striatellus TaxID=195883 RepID=A0A482X642_LAOST|nr:hypothetical protein LSTR_LSTR010465 [Laodelphax striatellus]